MSILGPSKYESVNLLAIHWATSLVLCSILNEFIKSLMLLEVHLNSFKPGVPFMGHRQTE